MIPLIITWSSLNEEGEGGCSLSSAVSCCEYWGGVHSSEVLLLRGSGQARAFCHVPGVGVCYSCVNILSGPSCTECHLSLCASQSWHAALRSGEFQVPGGHFLLSRCSCSLQSRPRTLVVVVNQLARILSYCCHLQGFQASFGCLCVHSLHQPAWNKSV